jgi:hypothetical protein
VAEGFCDRRDKEFGEMGRREGLELVGVRRPDAGTGGFFGVVLEDIIIGGARSSLWEGDIGD